MITSRFYLRESGGITISRLLLDLPENIRPTHYAESNNRVHASNEVSNTRRFEQFVAMNREGFFLVGPKCKYDLVLLQSDVDYSHVDVYPTQEIEDASSFFDHLLGAVGACAEFGLTCSEAEFRHSNFFDKQLGETSIESWLGLVLKDHSIPGVFWRTFLSASLVNRHNVDLSTLPSCVGWQPYQDRGVILSEAVGINDWPSIRDEIDRYIDVHAAFFSKNRMLSALPDTDEPLVLMRAIKRYQAVN